MICISILCFGHIANKSSDILSILKEVIIFPEKDDLSYRVDRNGHRLIFAGNRRCASNHHEIFTAS